MDLCEGCFECDCSDPASRECCKTCTQCCDYYLYDKHRNKKSDPEQAKQLVNEKDEESKKGPPKGYRMVRTDF